MCACIRSPKNATWRRVLIEGSQHVFFATYIKVELEDTSEIGPMQAKLCPCINTKTCSHCHASNVRLHKLVADTVSVASMLIKWPAQEQCHVNSNNPQIGGCKRFAKADLCWSAFANDLQKHTVAFFHLTCISKSSITPEATELDYALISNFDI